MTRREAARIYRDEGIALAAVARRCGRSSTWVRTAVMQFGEMRSNSAAQHLRRGSAHAHALAGQLLASRLPTVEIARRSGLTLRSVQWRMRIEGKGRRESEANYLLFWGDHPQGRARRDRAIKIFELYRSGLLQREIGEIFGLHQTAVGRIIRQIRDGVPYLEEDAA